MGGVTLPNRDDPVILSVLWFKLPLLELGVLNKLDEQLDTLTFEHELPLCVLVTIGVDVRLILNGVALFNRMKGDTDGLKI